MNNSSASGSLLANDLTINSTGLTVAGDNVIEGLTTAFNLLTQASSSILAVCGAIFTSTTWHVMRFFLLRVPSWVVVSSSVSITLSFYTLLLVLFTIMFATYYVLSGRFLHAYKRLQPDDSDEKLLKDKKFRDETEALFANKSESQRKGGFTSYLDEFLSAIKIFGYLEKPVFHELTKSMKTRRLEEGEVLLVDDALGFAIVVEGSLQTYHKVQRTNKNLTGSVPDFLDGSNSDSLDDAASDCDAYSLNGEKYQLLNIVRAGNPVSSLVSILRLFTGRNDTPLSNSIPSFPASEEGYPGFMSPFLDSTLENHASELRNTSRTQKLAQEQLDSGPRSPNTENIRGETKDRPENTVPFEGSLPDIIACAPGDCTIAIIPASAFRRLTSKFPRSASHIIQMVLTKLYRVTFQTAHTYLGLTKEIINTEVVLNRSNNIELPYYLKEAAIRKIKAQELFKKEEQLKTPKTGPKTRTPIGRRSSKGRASPHSFLKNRGSRHVVLDSRDHLNPGDLLSNVPLSRKDTPTIRGVSNNSVYQSESAKSKSFRNSNNQVNAQLSSLSSLSDKAKAINKSGKSSALSAATNEDDEIRERTFSAAQEETEESSWRIALVEGMFSYLGITKENILPTTDDDDDALSLRRSSEVSLTPSSQMSAPSAFRLLSPDQFVTKKGPKVKPKQEYKEEIPYNIDFDTVKDEFAQGLQTMFVREGSILVSQNTHNKGLYYIISGTMEVIWTNEEDHTQHILHNIKSGGIAGYLASLIGSKSFVTLRAKTDLYVGFLPVPTLERLCDKYFMIYLRIAETLINLLNPKILKLDYALEWIHLDASEILFNQDEPANAIYVVLSGRLRQLHRSNKTKPEALERKNKKRHLRDSSKVRAIREYAQGESLGEVDVLTAINRLSTVVALRDTELARIPRTLFELLAMEHPSIMIRVSRLVARKILQQQRGSEAPESINSAKDYKYDFNLLIPPTETTKGSVINSEHGASAPSDGDSRHSYRTITILPITQGLPVEEFASKLVTAFKQVGMSTIGLNQSATLSHLGRHAFDGLSKLKQSGYFAELEEIYDTVVYIADTPTNSSWTTTCINQGDCILLLAHSAMTPDIGEFERLLIKSKSNARIELILLHAERYVEPGLTHKWLKNRMWVHSHHHMQFSSPSYVRDKEPEAEPESNTKTFIRNLKRERLNHITRQTQENISRLLPDSLKSTVENFSSKFINKKSQFYTPVLSHKNDFLRLARILSGKAIGLVLGGGGARGISHLGVLRAIEEHGIPIDMIGGTSIGAFVGGLYAKDYDLVPIYGRMKKFAGRVGSVWRLLTDLTWPVTSYTTGHEFNRGIWKTFGDIRIEDFWIQYYCNSTNITESIQEIHSTGYAWRYIRASMSLAGLLPPIEDNGSMLLDGGYVDNLPVWEMKARGCNTIFAVDVGSVDDRTPQRYGDSLNGFWIVFNRWNPFSDYPNIPNMTEIQMRLGYVASVNALEKAKNTPGVIYARPPIEDYATLDFAKFEEIYQVGTAYGHDFFQELEKQKKMPHIPGSEMLADDPESRHRMLYRRNSV
ncbi:lysophospholipase [Lachancea thermotolerans CBS 6340]|uniref:Lysophospholipase NTE1 n=1 Tax=Lachancea thermotolerans (strain ATCC 56472 / CBS 6340 / NRRL Y-8284) TaxID=559295 RepID=C5DFL3_LACTC|nr:KLTH0D16060p [Lachancea thermotolerans CBS 6340]CAR22968.1 KLTH0D16060p [Lachancea thermotolerans CBS 6340]